MLVEMEGDFDLHAAIYRLAAGANGAEHAAARAAAFAGAKSSAGATADTGAIAISERISDALSQGIAEVRHIGAGDFQIGRTEQGRVHRQLGIQILDLYLRRGELRHRELGELPFGRGREGMVVRPAATAGFVRA